MRKIIHFAVILMTMVCTLTIGASASSFDSSADMLNELGLFQGGNSGYELDREPTRAEAAVMLTRMLGQEEAAQAAYDAGDISHPFTDTSAWMDPYIAYLYENDYTTGSTATTFDPTSICSDQMYVTFLLRSLGYFESQGDFTYAESLAFGGEIGLVDAVNLYGDSFLRDNVVALTLTALTVTPKGGDETLYEVLKADGVVPEDTSAGTLLDAYQQISGLIAPEEKLSSMTATIIVDASIVVEEVNACDFDAQIDMILDVDMDALEEMQMSMSVNYALSDTSGMGVVTNESGTMNIYIKDDWCYVDYQGLQAKYPLNLGELETALGDVEAVDSASLTFPIALIRAYAQAYGADVFYLSDDFIARVLTDMGIGDSIYVTDSAIYMGETDDGVLYMGFICNGQVYDGSIDNVIGTVPLQMEVIFDNFDEVQDFDFPSDLDSYTEAEL